MGNFSDINTVELMEKAKNGDKEAQSIMVEQNMGLVWSIVKKVPK